MRDKFLRGIEIKKKYYYYDREKLSSTELTVYSIIRSFCRDKGVNSFTYDSLRRYIYKNYPWFFRKYRDRTLYRAIRKLAEKKYIYRVMKGKKLFFIFTLST